MQTTHVHRNAGGIPLGIGARPYAALKVPPVPMREELVRVALEWPTKPEVEELFRARYGHALSFCP